MLDPTKEQGQLLFSLLVALEDPGVDLNLTDFLKVQHSETSVYLAVGESSGDELQNRVCQFQSSREVHWMKPGWVAKPGKTVSPQLSL
jgi:hypothetical protein